MPLCLRHGHIYPLDLQVPCHSHPSQVPSGQSEQGCVLRSQTQPLDSVDQSRLDADGAPMGLLRRVDCREVAPSLLTL